MTERKIYLTRRERNNKHKQSYEPTGETYGPANSPIYKKNGRKYIKVMTGNIQRYLIFPELSDKPIININCKQILSDEWEQLQNQTKQIITREARLQVLQNYEKNQHIKLLESKKRKEELEKEMKQAQKEHKLNIIEKDNERKRRYILDRAKEMMLDLSEPVREFNSLIAEKKCIATWDLQLKEKEKIEEEQKQEKLLEQNEAEKLRKEGIKNDEIARQKEREKNHIFITGLNAQIKERENDKKLAWEIQQQQRKRINKANKLTERIALAEIQQKNKDNAKIRDEQKQVNVLLQRIKAIDREEDIVYFEKSTEASDYSSKVLEERKKLKKLEEQKKHELIDKATAEKIKANEMAEFQEHMENVLRNDNIEREWRKKKLVEEKHKKSTLDAQMQQLEYQVKVSRLAKAKVIEDERREVCKNAKENVEDEYADLQFDRKKKIANEKQRLEILMQINDLERRKLIEREDRILESNYQKLLEEKRVLNTRGAMWNRLFQVEKEGLPQNYVGHLKQYVTETYGALDEADTSSTEKRN